MFTLSLGFKARVPESAEPPIPPLALSELEDVVIVDPQNGDELVYRDGAWRNEQ